MSNATIHAYSTPKAKTFLCGTCVPQAAKHSHRPRSSRSLARLTTYASAADVAGLLVFSAIPFVAVQSLADSKYGKQLLEDLKAQRPLLVAAAAAVEKSRAVARSQSPWYGPDRPQWLGPLSQQPPEWLDGKLPGDYGYDPLSLGRSRENLDTYVELELLHARWAMLGGLGALIPEALELSGKSKFLEPVWWRVGAAKLNSDEDLNYLGIAGLKVAGGQGVAIIAICQMLLMFGPEYARACGIEALEPLGIFLPGDKNYPGGVFDPLGLGKDPRLYETMRIREIKNGRLAMVAWLGFASQAAVTGRGPLENLLDFLENPSTSNVIFNL